MHGGRDALDALVGLASVREDQVGVAVRAGDNGRAYEAVKSVVDIADGRQVCWQWAIEFVGLWSGATVERKVACYDIIQVLELRGQGSG